MKNILIITNSFSLLPLGFGQIDITKITEQKLKENTLGFSVIIGFQA